jgi:hypothetical protein
VTEVINLDVHLTERSDLWYGVIQYTGATTHSGAGAPIIAGDIENIGGSMLHIVRDIRPQPAEGIGIAIRQEGSGIADGIGGAVHREGWDG